MSAAQTWQDCKLFDLEGKEIGSTRVPYNPMPPAVCVWGHRVFAVTLPHGDYTEVRAHRISDSTLVLTQPGGAGLPFRKAEK